MLSQVQLTFDALMTEKQAAWLATTSVPLRSVTLHKGTPTWSSLHRWSDVKRSGDALPAPMPALEVTHPQVRFPAVTARKLDTVSSVK